MSLIAKLAAVYLKLTRVNDKNYQKEIKKIVENGETRWMMPRHISDDIEQDFFEEMKYYYVNRNSNYKNVLFYIHGGYYLHQPLIYHVNMLKKIIKDKNTMLVFPVYPLAPVHTVEESFEIMKRFFMRVQEENKDKNIILAGDSAGGGYALALAESLDKQPNQLLLLSPWVDITMSNHEIEKYKKLDPMLCINKAIYAGNAWRGQYDAKDYHVSPINGNLSKLDNVTIFMGTREALYPDIMLLNNKLKALGKNVTLIIGEGQNHVYPAFPTREGHQAIKQIIDIINK